MSEEEYKASRSAARKRRVEERRRRSQAQMRRRKRLENCLAALTGILRLKRTPPDLETSAAAATCGDAASPKEE
ncbi:hypothetical protein [Phenylobacterium sp.]|jgi:hypothetical protein|uniref:hypothetical protein n=1 Tax=Phenylobacterium sp. TaxID=1871053 RepID=UPI002F412330